MKDKKPRKLSLVQFDFTDLSDEYVKSYSKVFPKDTPIVFLGEIPNMPEHCVVFVNGKIVFGYHTENFVEIDEDDV